MGAEFATRCDLRLAKTNARFAWHAAPRGLVPATGAASGLRPRLPGHLRALALVLERVPPESLLHRAPAPAEEIAAASPFSRRRMKTLDQAGLGRDVGTHRAAHAEALGACFDPDEHAEGVAAFPERRPPRFPGR